MGMAFESSLMFGIYSQAKLFLRGTLPDDGPRPEIIVPSAMFGGAIISFVLCPTELVKNAAHWWSWRHSLLVSCFAF